MHPKQICTDFASMGSPLVLDGDDLYIEHPENIYPELEELAKNYKSRIVAYLKGEYSDNLGIEQDMNGKINDWLKHDGEATKMVMELTIELSYNGWNKVSEPICNYENKVIDKLSKEIFERAMVYFKNGVVMG
ncbi:hypothetical protein V7068_03205 [Bacillus sp. JJ634]